MTPALLHEAILGAADAHRDRTALVDGDIRLSYEELAAGAQRARDQLVARGVAPGDRVAFVADNSAAYLIATLGTWMASAVPATAYPSSGRSELDYVLDNAAPVLVLVDRARRDVVAAVAGRLEIALLDELVEDGPTARSPGAPEADAPALICYTSGTTARPKPVMHSHAGLTAAAEAYASVWRITADDRMLVCLPMAWVYGLVTASVVTLVRGGTVVILPHFNPVRVVETIERERVTVFPGVTTMFTKLVHYAAAGRDVDLRSLRFCVAGGEPRNEATFDRWRELTGCAVHDVYAASECFPVVTYDPHDDPEPRRGSAGRLVPGAQMRLCDPAGADVAAGEVGEAFWRAPALMLGYNGEPALTRAAVTDDGWYRTGDYVRVDDEGYVYVVGRVTDMIIRGGSNVSPAEVEAVLSEHPHVAEVAVVGLPDPEYGERVAAAVVVTDGVRLDEQAIATFLAGRLAPYKRPTVVRQVDNLPRNATGKVVRRDVARLLADSVAAS